MKISCTWRWTRHRLVRQSPSGWWRCRSVCRSSCLCPSGWTSAIGLIVINCQSVCAEISPGWRTVTPLGKRCRLQSFYGGCDIGLSYFADNALQIYIRRSYAPATIPCAKSKLKRTSQRSSNFSEMLVFLYGVQWWLYCQQVYCSLLLSLLLLKFHGI